MKTPPEFDFQDLKVGEDYKFKRKIFMTTHSWRTITGLVIIAIIGALQALHGIGGWGAWIDMIVPVLLVLEHALKGKTN